MVVETVFTNAATEFSDANGVPIALQLHQSLVGTWSAKGVTLKINIRELILIDFESGIPVIAKHVGLLDRSSARTDCVPAHWQRVFEVVFDPQRVLVDGPRIASMASARTSTRPPCARLRIGTSEGAQSPPPDR